MNNVSQNNTTGTSPIRKKSKLIHAIAETKASAL